MCVVGVAVFAVVVLDIFQLPRTLGFVRCSTP